MAVVFSLRVETDDAITFIGVIVLTSTIAVLARYVPARRAGWIDPVIVLQQ